MKIATFNVNSLRARLGIVTGWLEKESPDVLCLQETKVEDALFPEGELKEAGYSSVFRGEKGYNGVAVLTREPVESFSLGFDGDGEAGTRLMTVTCRGVTVINSYVPQGVSPRSDRFVDKLEFLTRLHDLIDERFTPGSPLVWTGDFNVAPAPEDVHDPEALDGQVGFHPDEREIIEEIRGWGFVDLFRLHDKNPGRFSFWDYRARGGVEKNRGWRIDHIWATRPLAEKCSAAWIDREPRLLEKPSDHTPVVAVIDV